MKSEITVLSEQRLPKLGGWVPFSATDYPGKLAAVIFIQGCPWRCAYCHNPHLQARDGAAALSWEQAMVTLQRRQGLLDAVVFSGGEPTLDPGLESAIRQVRELGYQVGLHTGGAYPKRLESILPLLDWVGLDVKAPFDRYESITGIAGSGEPARMCAQMLAVSGVAHEVRTTIHPDLLTHEDLLHLAQSLATMGVQRYALQLFRQQGCENATLAPVSAYPDPDVITQIAAMFERFTIRSG